MNNLNADIILNISSFMDQRDAVVFTHVNKDAMANRGPLLISQYQKTFGEINNIYQRDKKIIARLLCCAEKQPNAAVNHNIYKAPNSRLERWKWIVGVENSIDKEVKENYDAQISILENTQATSIFRLKNQMQAFWHSNREINDYEKFKSDEKAKATSGLISKIFFGCLGFLFKLYYNNSVSIPNIITLNTRSEHTFAKIGNFKHNSKDYDVVAFHPLDDGEDFKKKFANSSFDCFRKWSSSSKYAFSSVSSGKTYIGIFEKQLPHSFTSLGHHGNNPNFKVLIGREQRSGWILSEAQLFDEGKAVSNKRHLVIDNDLEYRDSTRNDVQGSNRLLDQKLTQIMVEMAMQNKETISLQVTSNYDDLPVLTAGGFKSNEIEETMRELQNFRSKAENNLFPPYRDYHSVATHFTPKDFAKQNVHYTRKAPEAWSDIIRREPILKPEAAILPEYWEKKPNIIE